MTPASSAGNSICTFLGMNNDVVGLSFLLLQQQNRTAATHFVQRKAFRRGNVQASAPLLRLSAKTVEWPAFDTMAPPEQAGVRTFGGLFA